MMLSLKAYEKSKFGKEKNKMPQYILEQVQRFISPKKLFWVRGTLILFELLLPDLPVHIITTTRLQIE